MAGLITDYIAQGAAASRPATPDADTGTLSFYFSTDTEVLSFYDWNDGAWQNVPLTGSGTTASTTEVLTGTDTDKSVTADALAALWEKGSDIASAGTISIGEGGTFHVTGTTTITDIDPATDKAGRFFVLIFDGALTLTHHATTLILPGGVNIQTEAGDTAIFVSEGSDAVRCVVYNRGSDESIGRGTSFPASPVTGQRFYRIDLLMEAVYDGTRWLSSQLFTFDLNTAYGAISATNTLVARRRNINSSNIYIVDVAWSVSLTGTGNWTIAVISSGGTTIDSITITASNFSTTSVNVASNGQTYYNLSATENSGTASVQPTVAVSYRLILT